MWNSRPWEPRPALNIFLNPWWLFQGNPESNFFSTSIFNQSMSLLLLFLYSCITVSAFFFLFHVSRRLLLIKPIQLTFLQCRPVFKTVLPHLDELKQRWDRFKSRIIHCNLQVSQLLWMSVSEASKCSCLFLAWLQAWQAIYNSRAKCRRVKEKGSENLSVLFLDRSPGPWYRWALEWRQDSDLKNSSGFCGPGSAPSQEMRHEPA